MNEFDEDAFVIGTMRWSFSRISSFDTCPKAWKKDYIECRVDEKDSSAQAQFGLLMHTILEKYAKGELSLFDLNDYYEEYFNKLITYDFPPNKYVDLREKYYQQGLDYLNNINLDFERYEILGVEKEVTFDIGGHECIGFIDLLLRDRTNGNIVIEDHKSASIGILKSGKIAKKDLAHFDSFKKQLYLYSKPVLEEYGHVDILKWNLFKEQKFIEIPFDEKEYQDSLIWAEDTIKRIENETEWGINKELTEAINNGKYPPFYCMNLCSFRYHCSEKYNQLEYLRILKEQENNPDWNWGSY